MAERDGYAANGGVTTGAASLGGNKPRANRMARRTGRFTIVRVRRQTQKAAIGKFNKPAVNLHFTVAGGSPFDDEFGSDGKPAR